MAEAKKTVVVTTRRSITFTSAAMANYIADKIDETKSEYTDNGYSLSDLGTVTEDVKVEVE